MSGTGPATWLPPGTNGATAPSVLPELWQWTDPTTLPPRPWLLGTTLLRGYTTLLGSPGGVGKTTWAVAAALSVVTGRRDLLNMRPFVQGKVWYITLEDDALEMRRRFAAAMLEHQVAAVDVQGDLIISGGELKLARYEVNGRTVVTVKTDEAGDIEQFIKDNNVVLCVIDPLVRAHSVNGNANEDMDVLIGICNSIARSTGCALLLPCHFRKGGDVDDDGRDAFRGASSLIDGARIALGMVGMTVEEGERFGVEEDDRGSFVRMVNAKANMTAKAEATDWYELTSVMLGNGSVDPTYPMGDSVQAIRHWMPPKMMDGMDYLVMQAVFARLGDASQVYHQTPGAGRNWAGTVLMALASRSKDQAAGIIKAWVASGTLVPTTYRHNYRDRTKLVLDQGKAAAILSGMHPPHSGP